MADIKLPQRSESAVKLHGKRGKQLSPEAMSFYTEEALRARDIEVAKLVLEAAAKVCDEVAVNATSEKRMKFLTVQGQAVYEGMYGGAINCAGGIRALEVGYHE